MGNVGLQQARKKREEMKAKGEKIKVRNPLEKLNEKPTSLRLAINAKCYDCNGKENWKKRTKYYNVFSCPLWTVRPYSKGITKNDCLAWSERND